MLFSSLRAKCLSLGLGLLSLSAAMSAAEIDRMKLGSVVVEAGRRQVRLPLHVEDVPGAGLGLHGEAIEAVALALNWSNHEVTGGRVVANLDVIPAVVFEASPERSSGCGWIMVSSSPIPVETGPVAWLELELEPDIPAGAVVEITIEPSSRTTALSTRDGLTRVGPGSGLDLEGGRVLIAPGRIPRPQAPQVDYSDHP